MKKTLSIFAIFCLFSIITMTTASAVDWTGNLEGSAYTDTYSALSAGNLPSFHNCPTTVTFLQNNAGIASGVELWGKEQKIDLVEGKIDTSSAIYSFGQQPTLGGGLLGSESKSTVDISGHIRSH